MKMTSLALVLRISRTKGQNCFKNGKKTGSDIFKKSFLRHGKRLKATIKKRDRESAIPTHKDCENSDKVKAESLASHFLKELSRKKLLL